jgi:bifunctional non-homologous end joining protein LigD
LKAMNARTGPDAGGTWTREPTYPKPAVSVRATTAYYQVMAPLMLPFIERRLLNLFRCRGERCYFQRSKAHPPSRRDFQEPVKFEAVKQKNGRTEDYLYVTDATGIVACANVQTVEFHGWGSRAGSVDTPDRLVIDLDPGEGATFEDVKAAALQVGRSLEEVGLESFPLLTGGKGIHVVVPLLPEAGWDELREFAKLFCTVLAQADPARLTVVLPKAQRRGRIFLDFLRNQRTATAVLPYSARAREGAPVAAPVTWAEVPDLPHARIYCVADAKELQRRAKRKLKGWGSVRQSLPKVGQR